MGRKNRRKPFACPVQGCMKRGLRADLARHAVAVHPEVARSAYLAALASGTMIGAPDLKPNNRGALIHAVLIASFSLSVIVILLAVALGWIANR